MVEMRLRASRSVCIRGDSGKLPRIWMSLSVKSIASCGCTGLHALATQARVEGDRSNERHMEVGGGGCLLRTPATPRFSMVGIL